MQRDAQVGIREFPRLKDAQASSSTHLDPQAHMRGTGNGATSPNPTKAASHLLAEVLKSCRACRGQHPSALHCQKTRFASSVSGPLSLETHLEDLGGLRKPGSQPASPTMQEEPSHQLWQVKSSNNEYVGSNIHIPAINATAEECGPIPQRWHMELESIEAPRSC